MMTIITSLSIEKDVKPSAEIEKRDFVCGAFRNFRNSEKISGWLPWRRQQHWAEERHIICEEN